MSKAAHKIISPTKAYLVICTVGVIAAGVNSVMNGLIWWQILVVVGTTALCLAAAYVISRCMLRSRTPDPKPSIKIQLK